MDCMLLNRYDDLKSGYERLAHQGHSARNWPKLYPNLKAVTVRKMHLSHHERNGSEFPTSLRIAGHNPVSDTWSLWYIFNLKAR